ncbi:RHOMBOID-like protein 5, partial [Pistacia vera]|uniref:RHOMBOID-like protein 5 n=1 Tax=Pistacia vera TaxID=55513 RepID=UPI00126342F0
CMFLHSSVVHLLFNIFTLLPTCIQLEEEFGFLKIGILYVLAGLGGSILSCLHQDPKKDIVSIGASSALFGFMGSMLSKFITNWTSYSDKVTKYIDYQCFQLMMLLVIICLNLLLGLIPGVDNTAHLGGFISGFFLGFVLLIRTQHGYVGRKYVLPGYETTRHKSKYQFHQQLCWITSFVILIAG